MSSFHIEGDGSRSLYSLLSGAFPDASCGGVGRCGKCRVRLSAGDDVLPELSAADHRFFTPAELAGGMRLACTCFPKGSCSGELTLATGDDGADGSSFNIVTTWQDRGKTASGNFSGGNPRAGLGIVADIGTTTIALNLVSLADGKVLASSAILNSQRRFGADVLSRIQAATDGHAGDLRNAVLADLREGINRLAAPHLSALPVVCLYLAANTVMTHLLLGLPSDGLGCAPFLPFALSFPDRTVAELFRGVSAIASTSTEAGASAASELPAGVLADCRVRIVPCQSAFIGGDIIAGISSLDMNGKDGPELLLDLGTNAEMVLALDGRYICTSAAAGPAFEGGNISCGTGSIAGAVSSVYPDGNRFGYSLIGGERTPSAESSPVGLCGSGLLDFIACALDAGLIRKDGSLAPVCENSGILLDRLGKVRLLASDVREFQLAKSAIRSGIEMLLEDAGVQACDVVHVYLAGGFGLYLKEKSALVTGLLPKEFSGKVEGVGNTSLAGAVKYLLSPEGQSPFNEILDRSHAVLLADKSAFSSHFISNMEF